MTWCKTCNKQLADDIGGGNTNAHVQMGHEVFTIKPNTMKLSMAHFFNHYITEPVIWAISAYGILMGIFATLTWGFFTLKEYSLGSFVFFLTPTQVQNLDLWYDAYPYSLMIFGSYLLALYIKFNYYTSETFNPLTKPTKLPLPHKGFLALPVFFLTYAMWDFTGIGVNLIHGYSIIWLGIAVISLIYYFPIRKQFEIHIPLISLLIFFGLGVMNLQDIFLSQFPFTHIIIDNNTIGRYLDAVANEATFCYLCLTSISLKKSS